MDCVVPGFADTIALLVPSVSIFSKEDFPTLERPIKLFQVAHFLVDSLSRFQQNLSVALFVTFCRSRMETSGRAKSALPLRSATPGDFVYSKSSSST